MSPHTIEFASGAVCYGAALLVAASVAARARKSRRLPAYPEVAARYAAERQAQREREDAAWRRVWHAVTYADDEPVAPGWDEFVTAHPWSPEDPKPPQQGERRDDS